MALAYDPVNPTHYKTRGLECIELVEMLPFCEGNAVKYLWRCGLKGSKLEDLEKARWYVRRASTSENALKVYRPRVFRWTLQRALDEFSDETLRQAINAIALRKLIMARALLDKLIADASAVPANLREVEKCAMQKT